jgi:thymidylate kinase
VDIAHLIDNATPERVVVVGSLPPIGRDLDLLVRPAAASALAGLLAANGFHVQGRVWARFTGCRAEVVELIPVADYDLDPEPLGRLFAEARPIDGLASQLRPAPHHRLLLIARRVATEGRLDVKRRSEAGSADDEAWRKARETAAAWRAERALSELERALHGRPPRSWPLRAVAARARRYRHGAVIALSGLDGSGKSTQAEGLERALSALGYPVVTIWTSLTAHPSLSRVAAPLRALLGHQREPSSNQQGPPAAGEDHDRLTRLRETTPWLHLAWVSVVATIHACWQARALRPHVLRGQIVICDRYTLDSLVHLRYRYGARRRYRLQLVLIRMLSPRPSRAYLLDVSPETARARNQEYTPEQTALRARLYREEYPGLGVTWLDGERSREELCEQVALEVWSALRMERDAARPALLRTLLAVYRRVRRR